MKLLQACFAIILLLGLAACSGHASSHSSGNVSPLPLNDSQISTGFIATDTTASSNQNTQNRQATQSTLNSTHLIWLISLQVVSIFAILIINRRR